MAQQFYIGATFSVFLLIFSFSINAFDVPNDNNISDNIDTQSSTMATVLSTSAIKNDNLTHKTPIKLNSSTHESTPRTSGVYLSLFCPGKTSSNQTTSENSRYIII